MIAAVIIRLCWVFAWILFSGGLYAQTVQDLAYDRFVQQVLDEHPQARQAELLTEMADARWLRAKGAFDPSLSAGYAQKTFDNKLYYRHFDGELRVPLNLGGIDLVGGYENNEGLFLNPEQTTDPLGLWSAGLEVNLLQGLIIDERRANLRIASIGRERALNQRQLVRNDLIFDATLAYLNWQEAFYILQLYQQNVAVAQNYLFVTRESFFGGEKSAIDTLEANILLQDRLLLLQKGTAKLQKAIQMLENFLWQDGQSQALPTDVAPEVYEDPLFDVLAITDLSVIADQHPFIQEKLVKQEMLEQELRLKRDKFKPKLKGKFNPLLATTDNSAAPTFVEGDFTWGLTFSMPLLYRKERGDVQLSRIKMEDNQLDINTKRTEILNLLENGRQQIVQADIQIAQLERNVEGYQLLLDAENEKFRFGESSVFLLNKRQEKLIDGQTKLIQLYIMRSFEQLKYRYYLNAL